MRNKKDNEQKTAFRIQYGYFEYQVISFSLSNTLTSFQKYINKILAEKLNIFVIVYLDDIFIYTKDIGQDHMIAVRQVLDILRKNGFFTNFKKCWFHKDEVCFLSYIISVQDIKIEDEQIEAFKNWPELKSIRDIQEFLGFANFYRCFIQGFNKIAVQLTSMLKTLLLISLSQSNKTANEVEVKNISSNIEFLYKSKKSKNSTNLSKFQSIEKTFLTSKTRIACN